MRCLDLHAIRERARKRQNVRKLPHVQKPRVANEGPGRVRREAILGRSLPSEMRNELSDEQPDVLAAFSATSFDGWFQSGGPLLWTNRESCRGIYRTSHCRRLKSTLGAREEVPLKKIAS
jgi:hypothetical protein